MSRILVLDIETSPMEVYTWGIGEQIISLNQIKAEWSVIAWAAKWLDEKGVVYRDQRNAKDVRDDKAILKPLWGLLDEADIVVTQNGQRFDGPKLNARFILHGMMPPSPYRHLDTYRIVKRVADFTSNKLEYLTDKICTKYKKLHHSKYPGMELWKQCLSGNVDAWNEMKKYNIHDVLSTEELYKKIRAWAPDNMPRPFVSSDNKKCGVCGGRTTKQGTRRNKKFLYQQYKCISCGAWSKGELVKDAA